jgi:hypothetical protein
LVLSASCQRKRREKNQDRFLHRYSSILLCLPFDCSSDQVS